MSVRWRIYFLLIIFLEPRISNSETLTQDSNSETLTQETITDEEVLFQADQVVIDDLSGVVTATGNVIVFSKQRTLYADTISYHQKEDVITASGNIRVHEKTGETLYAHSLVLSTDLREAFIENVQILSANNARFSGRKASFEEGQDLTIIEGVYSPCHLCAEHPDRPPVWQIRSARVRREAETRQITFYGLTLDMFGLPVFYLPYLSLPDPTVQRRSGLIDFNGGWNKNFGAFAAVTTYFDLTEYLDLTTKTTAYSNAYPLLDLHLRQRFETGHLDIKGALTYGSVTDAQEIQNKDQFRGRIFAHTRFDLNDEWRTGGRILWTSDLSFLQQHFSNTTDSFLESHVFAEGFYDRDYLSVNGLWFQSLQSQDSTPNPSMTKYDEPFVLPLISYTAIGNPHSLLGGNWKFSMDLRRIDHRLKTSDDVIESTRLSLEPSWNKTFINRLGMSFQLGFRLRSDSYLVLQKQPDSSHTRVTEYFRLLPEATLDVRYPLIRLSQTSTHRLDPRLMTLVAPTFSTKPQINEDSFDTSFDIDHLFSHNHWSGNDFQEAGIRIISGLEYTFSSQNSLKADLFLGQSFRLSKTSPFPEDSGLEHPLSDYVGKMSLSFRDRISTSYRFRFDQENFSPKAQNFHFALKYPSLEVETQYILDSFFSTTQQTYDQREGFSVSLAWRPAPYWRTKLRYSHNLRHNPGPYQTALVLEYQDECFFISTVLQQDHYDSSNLSDGLSVSLNISFKNPVE